MLVTAGRSCFWLVTSTHSHTYHTYIHTKLPRLLPRRASAKLETSHRLIHFYPSTTIFRLCSVSNPNHIWMMIMMDKWYGADGLLLMILPHYGTRKLIIIMMVMDDGDNVTTICPTPPVYPLLSIHSLHSSRPRNPLFQHRRRRQSKSGCFFTTWPVRVWSTPTEYFVGVRLSHGDERGRAYHHPHGSPESHGLLASTH